MLNWGRWCTKCSRAEWGKGRRCHSLPFPLPKLPTQRTTRQGLPTRGSALQRPFGPLVRDRAVMASSFPLIPPTQPACRVSRGPAGRAKVPRSTSNAPSSSVARLLSPSNPSLSLCLDPPVPPPVLPPSLLAYLSPWPSFHEFDREHAFPALSLCLRLPIPCPLTSKTAGLVNPRNRPPKRLLF